MVGYKVLTLGISLSDYQKERIPLKIRHSLLLAVLSFGLFWNSTSFAYDCNSDCSGRGYDYPCPTWKDPGRTCHGNLPPDPLCLTSKKASCEIWEGAVTYASEKIKPLLKPNFNHVTWAAAQTTDTTDQYTQTCVAAGIAACGALGAELGGPWGGVVSGALGTFVSFRVCDQSKTW